MQMISATKLKRAQNRIERARPYVQKLDDILSDILASVTTDDLEHPLTAEKTAEETKRVALMVITSDKGLCGSFNANIIRKASDVIKEGLAKGIEYELIPIGRRGLEFFRRRGEKILRSDLIHIDQDLPTSFLTSFFRYIVSLYTGEGHESEEEFTPFDKVEVIFAFFQSALVYRVQELTLLPLELGHRPGEPETYGETKEYIFEPGPRELFEDIIPQVIRMRLFRALAETIASEQGARMVAMQNAPEHAGDMINWLTLQRNKARQSAITTELSDIVGGAEALKG